ncbi:MAG: acyl-CoA hydratase [bacterium TMED88]|nr:acyl-CoA hydratase [Deltaproteobacteria bacterium]OUV24718.1 MAG: acyl-CoA hydratase [bacterium TMED88]
MYDLMQGVRVIEVAEHTFVPAAGVVLADWGADVIKVERTTGGGDPARNMLILQRPGQTRNEYFEVANRGKRSVALDLTQGAGREQLYRLVEEADVFTTNLRTSARRKLKIEPEDLMARNPRLVYARGTGYGMQGPMAEHGGFDYPSSWCRSGSGFAQTPESGPPPQQPGSVGDLTGGATLAGAISAALFRRERTGQGAVVDHALYLMGAYIMTQSLTGASLSGAQPGEPSTSPRGSGGHPLVRLYRTQDDRWLSLCFLQDRWFADLARRLGREDLLADKRFVDEPAKMANADALVDELQSVFETKTLDQWKEILFTMEGVWAPLLNPAEVIHDQQALRSGIVTQVSADDGDYLAASTPGQFDESPIGELTASPRYGEHTDEVMSELGLSQDQIARLRSERVLV